MAILKQDIVREATRLTRAGQLVEAAALLQRMLGSERAPDAPLRTTDHIAPSRREPPTIDVEVNVVKDTERQHLARATSARPRPRAFFHHLKEGPGVGLPGLVKRAPPSAAEIAPEGGKFIERFYSNPAGRLTYKLFVP